MPLLEVNNHFHSHFIIPFWSRVSQMVGRFSKNSTCREAVYMHYKENNGKTIYITEILILAQLAYLNYARA